MAKEVLFELDINADKVLQDIAKSKSTIEGLRESINNLKKAEGDHSIAIADLTAQMQAESKQLRTNETLAKNLVIANKASSDTIEVLRAKLSAATIEWSRYTEAGLADSSEGKKLNQQKTDLTETLKKLTKATGDHRMEVGNYELSTKSIKQELKELKTVMLNNAEGSEAYTAALKRASDVTLELREMQERIKGSSKDLGDILNNTTKVMGGFASGFEIIQGVQALVGIENENLQKSLLKVQSAIAIANGLQGLEGMGKSFKNLMTQLMQFTIVQKLVTAAQWLWNLAMEANPIGLIVAGVVALSAAVYGLTKMLQSSFKEFVKQRTAIDGVVFATIEAKKAHEEHLAVMEDLEVQYALTTGQITKFQAAMIGLERDYKKSIRNIQEETAKNVDNVHNGWTNLYELVASGGNIFALNSRRAKAESDARREGIIKMFDTIKEFIEKTKILEAEKAKEDKERNEKLAKESIERANKALEDEKKRIKALNDLRKSGSEEAFKIMEKSVKDDIEAKRRNALEAMSIFEQELEAYKATQLEHTVTQQERINFEYESEKRSLEKKMELGLISEKTMNDQLNVIRIKANDDISKLNEQARQLESDARIEAAKNDTFRTLDLEKAGLEEKYLQEIDFANKIGADTTAIEEKFANARKEIKRAEENAKLSIMNNVAATILNIAGEQSRLGKAAAVAQTLISTYAAAQAAFAGITSSTGGWGIAAAIAAAASAVTFGLANVKKILSVKLPISDSGGGGQSTSGSSSGMPSATKQSSVSPDVGQGIVSRSSVLMQKDKINLQPTLVINEVTANQNKEFSNFNTSIL
jgi:hypothetical protein